MKIGKLKYSPEHYAKMTFDDKRKLLQSVFTGKDPDGNRCGVYIKKDNKDKKQPWLYEIRGNFISEVGRLPIKQKSELSHDRSAGFR
jgi:hypothetical protein